MEAPESSDTEVKSGTVVRRALGWLGSAYRRLSLSMFLSILLHAAVILLVILVLIYLNVEEREVQSPEISVTLMSADEIEEVSPNSLPEGHETEPMILEDEQPTLAETVEQQLRAEHDKEMAVLAEEIEQSADQIARAEAEKRILELEEQYRQELDRRVQAVADMLGKSSEQVAKLRQQANDVIGKIAKNEQRRRRWARWTIRHVGYLGIERVGGRLLVKGYPKPNQYTYIVNVGTSPRQKLGPKPDTYLFVSTTKAGLASDTAKCREAGVTLAPGTFIPFCVFPEGLEERLAKLEHEEMNKRGIGSEGQIVSTYFDLRENGTISLISMVLQKTSAK